MMGELSDAVPPATTIYPEGFDATLAPDAFMRWANHYYECRQSFAPKNGFSPVPYFLLCRSIELAIKARHLHMLTQAEVKSFFRHDLWKAYDALDQASKVLSQQEEQLLQKASLIYKDKDFEYFDPEDALSGFGRYPSLDQLDAIATKMLAA